VGGHPQILLGRAESHPRNAGVQPIQSTGEGGVRDCRILNVWAQHTGHRLVREAPGDHFGQPVGHAGIATDQRMAQRWTRQHGLHQVRAVNPLCLARSGGAGQPDQRHPIGQNQGRGTFRRPHGCVAAGPKQAMRVAVKDHRRRSGLGTGDDLGRCPGQCWCVQCRAENVRSHPHSPSHALIRGIITLSS